MRVLVTGSGGLLGSNIIARATKAGHVGLGTYHTSEPNLSAKCEMLDISDVDAFRDLIDEFGPDSIVNCAALTNVDACESSQSRAKRINGIAPGKMAEICSEKGIGFTQISTDYVFDGECRSKYTEDSEPNPIQTYGESKLLGERNVSKGHPSPLIVRLSFVYGIHGATRNLRGFPAWVMSRLSAGKKVPLYVDQSITPTRAEQAAKTILSLITDEASGTYHVACTDCVSPYEFGEAICDQIEHDSTLLNRSSVEDVTKQALRPPHTCLDVRKTEDELNRSQPTLSEDLQAIREKLEESVS